jgi:hypothetical protein
MVRILAHLALTENPLRHRFHTVCLNFGAPVKPARSRWRKSATVKD